MALKGCANSLPTCLKSVYFIPVSKWATSHKLTPCPGLCCIRLLKQVSTFVFVKRSQLFSKTPNLPILPTPVVDWKIGKVLYLHGWKSREIRKSIKVGKLGKLGKV